MTPRSGWPPVAVVFLLVLAGCSVFSPPAEEPITETVTPVPVPSAADAEAPTPATGTPTVASGLDEFPGVSSQRGIDAERLLAAHVSYLSARSYTVEWARWTGGGTGPVADRFQRRVEVADNTTYLRRERGGRYGTVTSTYVGPEGAYRRAVSDETIAVTSVAVRDSDPARERFARLVTYEVRAFLAAGYDELDVVERGGRRYARAFVTHPPPDLTEIYDTYAVRNFSATVWIAPEGYVRALHYEFDLVGARSGFAVEWRYAYSAVGETTVEQPPWVPTNATARPSTNESSTGIPSAEMPITVPSRVPPPAVAEATTPGRVDP